MLNIADAWYSYSDTDTITISDTDTHTDSHSDSHSDCLKLPVPKANWKLKAWVSDCK